MGIPVITAGRLVLTPWAESDALELYNLWTQPAIRDAIWDGEAIPVERAAETVREAVETASSAGVGCWTIRMASAPFSVMGFCGLRSFDDSCRIELLAALAPQHWGQGLATVACRAALAYAFHLGHEHIYARISPGNTGCIQLVERLGMKIHASAWIDDSPDLCFSLSAEEFRRAEPSFAAPRCARAAFAP